MHASTVTAEQILSSIVNALPYGDELFAAVDALPAPIYLTDPEGLITHFNRACIEFAGRIPAVGKDLWCVTWKLYTEDGEFLPHDQCPMALAVRQKRPIRGVSAVAERPDGSRVNFIPFPTPLFGQSGDMVGAVNILIDVTDVRQVAALRTEAQKCRRLASAVGDRATVDTLTRMADEYEAKALELELKRMPGN